MDTNMNNVSEIEKLAENMEKEFKDHYVPLIHNQISKGFQQAITPISKSIEEIRSCLSLNDCQTESQLSASTFGSHLPDGVAKIEDWFDDPVNIEQYCLDRLAEIRQINSLSHTPSAFSVIFSFMGFLAQFAGVDDQESHGYSDLTMKYMRHLRCCVKNVNIEGAVVSRTWVSSKKLGDQNLFNTWGEVLYSLGRCGLVHSLSTQGNRDVKQDQIDLRLTHGKVAGSQLVDLFVSNNGVDSPAFVISNATEIKQIVISADDLCDSVQYGIVRMFQNPDVVNRARTIMQTRPAIMAVID